MKESTNIVVKPADAPYIDPQIVIDGESDLVNQSSQRGWAGTGSLSQPFMIQNMRIAINTTANVGINITGIQNFYFIIQNVTILGDNNSLDANENGICLTHVNGSALRNNNFINLNYEIWTYMSYNLTLSNNTSVSDDNGIQLQFSNYNNCIANIAQNDLGAGINLYECASSNVSNNYAQNVLFAAIYVEQGCMNDTFINNYANNSVYAFKLFNNAGYWNNSFFNNFALNCAYFGYLYLSSNSIFIGNVVQNDFEYGIFLWDSSDNNTIVNNYLGDSPVPIYLDNISGVCTGNIVSPNYINPTSFNFSVNPLLSNDGMIIINWTNSLNAGNYSLWLNSSIIQSGLKNNSVILSGLNDGSYTFSIMANNLWGNTVSNPSSINIIVQRFPTLFSLPVNPINSATGNLSLNWTASKFADNYTIYLNSIPVAFGITKNSYIVPSIPDGIYTCYVQAFNIYGNATSNTITVINELSTARDKFNYQHFHHDHNEFNPVQFFYNSFKHIPFPIEFY